MPTAKPIARALAHCPRERMVRVCAWYFWERHRDASPTNHLTGIRLLIRGWDDFYMTNALPSGAVIVSGETPTSGRALVTRHVRVGRGWSKEKISTTAEIRPEIELATRWLGSLMGCIVHDDCADNPELGAACALEAARASLS